MIEVRVRGRVRVGDVIKVRVRGREGVGIG